MKLEFNKIIIIIILFFFLAACSRTPQRLYYLVKHCNNYKESTDINDTVNLRNLLEKDEKLKFREGNKLTILQTGEKVLSRKMELIKNAKKEICIDQYIFRKDEVGLEFFKILEKKAQASVKVRIIIDNISSFKPTAYFSKRLKYTKLQVRLFNPLFWWSIIKINNRNHNKILIVDQNTAIISGIGLGKEYKLWHDIGVEIEGPVIYDIQKKFEDTWIKAGYGWFGKDLPIPVINAVKLEIDKLFYKKNIIDTDILMQKKDEKLARYLFTTAEYSDRNTFESFLKVINSSKKNIYITNAYFMPNIILRNALINAVKRGVNVKIILPSKSDLPFLRRSSQMYYKTLLENGIEIYELQDNILHAKYMIVDDIWATIGSTNFLDRSFFCNIEANIEVLDENFANALKKIFLKDLEHSKIITLENWKNRSFSEKLQDYLFLPTILLY